MWRLFEPVHAITYFAPECTEEFQRVGLKGFWMGYFAGRSAPMGPVQPAVVDATFFSFNPARVARALPDAWRLASPARVLEARLAGVDGVLRPVLGTLDITASRHGAASTGRDTTTSTRVEDRVDVARATQLVRAALEGLRVVGRPLAAANAALPWPDDSHLALWHAATILREHRGDGHVAALVAAGLDGREALVTAAATGAVPRALLQAARGWDDDEWEAAVDALVGRGWLRADGTLSPKGSAARREIEVTTDRLAAEPWDHLGPERTAELRALLTPMARAIAGTGVLPVPNPIGLPLPE
jgi:hypothetical protein